MTKDQIEKILLDITAKVSGNSLETVTKDSKLVDDLGLDSIDMFDILAHLSDKTSLSLERDDFKDIQTVGDFLTALELLIQKK